MGKINSKKKKIFRSIAEFEKEFFPNSYGKKIKEEKELSTFGAELATEFLENIKSKLSKL